MFDDTVNSLRIQAPLQSITTLLQFQNEHYCVTLGVMKIPFSTVPVKDLKRQIHNFLRRVNL